MSEFELFFAANVKPVENMKYAATTRIKDKEGNPVKWELRALSEDENEALKKECITIKTDSRGRRHKDFDDTKYATKLLVASVVYPDLENQQLQDAWGVRGADRVLKKLLTAGEFTLLQDKALEVSGFKRPTDEGIDADLIEEAEN